MRSYKPYLAVDIECTGLDREKSQVLQVAAVWDNGKPIEECPQINLLVKHELITHGEPVAMGMNGNLLGQIAKEGRWLPEARVEWDRFLYECSPKVKVLVAGKNAATFDLPILNNNGFATHMFSHRVLDVGSLYFADFGYLPTLDEINKSLSRNAVTHDALQDCYDVVTAIREKLK